VFIEDLAVVYIDAFELPREVLLSLRKSMEFLQCCEPEALDFFGNCLLGSL
jgi:hypothetical protein